MKLGGIRRGVGPRARGFTLVELLVVIGIMALLMGIVLPTFLVMGRQNRRDTCAANAPTKVRNRIQKASVCMRPLRSLSLRLQRLDHRRHDLEQVADDAVVGDLEDWRVGILVDGDDRVRALHADQMLDRA